MAFWTLSHTNTADLTQIAAALRQLDPSFNLLDEVGERSDFRLGKIPVRLAVGREDLQELVWDARNNAAWDGPSLSPHLSGLVDVIPGKIGEDLDAVEGIYNPMKRLPKPVREKINRVQTETNKAFDAAWGLAKKMFDANGKAGTVFLDPYVRDPASRFTALSAQAAGEAMRLLEEDERIAEQRADSTQDRDGRLPRPWENGWASAVEGLTERQARAYRWLVAQQTSESEIALDVRASGEHATIVAIAPAADPTWRGDMSDVIEDIFKRHWFFLISQQTCLAALPEEQVRATARPMNCVFTDLPDLLSEAENFFL